MFLYKKHLNIPIASTKKSFAILSRISIHSVEQITTKIFFNYNWEEEWQAFFGLPKKSAG